MTDPHPVDFFGVDPVSHDPGVMDRELEVDGTRWALVEYSPGEITYSFEDDRDPLIVGAGEGFALPPAPRHRGRNEGAEPARLFLIDALPGG
jgi:hypothetical protein